MHASPVQPQNPSGVVIINVLLPVRIQRCGEVEGLVQGPGA